MDEDRYRYRYREMRLNGRIVITAIVCLFVVVVIVVLLYIYARCVLRRQARRRAALRQLGIPVGITTTMAQMNEPKRGLSESVITSLPSFVYKNVDHMNNSGNPIECSVCLCTLEDEEMARLLPNCKHTFHAECIDMWLNSHSTCPICRTEAEPSDQLQPQPAAESAIELGQLSGAGGVPAAVATAPAIEGTSSNSAKVGRTESSSRLSSFRRMLSRERTETTTRIQQTDHRERTETTTRIQQTDHGVRDIEWQ